MSFRKSLEKKHTHKHQFQHNKNIDAIIQKIKPMKKKLLYQKHTLLYNYKESPAEQTKDKLLKFKVNL